MFKNKNNLDKQIKKVENETISSIIDQNMVIDGELRFKGKTRIDGTVNGNIHGEHLILSKTGTINGDLSISSLVCHGRIDGNISAGILTARKGCSIQGKLEAENLIVEPGASLDGEVRTAQTATPSPDTDGSVPTDSENDAA